jgi:hypothetical protein
MTMQFMTPPRIVLPIKLRRLAKRNRKQMDIGIVRNARVIKRHFSVVLFNRLFLGGRGVIVLLRRGRSITLVVDDILDALLLHLRLLLSFLILI